MRIVFMGTPDFGSVILTALKEAGHQIVGVLCQPDKPKGRCLSPTPPPVKECAAEIGVPVWQPRKLGPKSRATLLQMAPDAIVVAAYGRILPVSVLEIPCLGCINVHASLLPKYRGAAPIHWALANGEDKTGVTIMQMNEGLDTGDMLAAASTPISPHDTAQTLHDRLSLIGADLLVQTLSGIEAGVIRATPQDNRQASLAPILTRENGIVDWSWSGAKIADRVRGFHPWPGATTSFRGKTFKLFPFLTSDPGPAISAPGTIVAVTKEGLSVTCGDGTVTVPEVQQAGKRRMDASSWASGARAEIGERLGA